MRIKPFFFVTIIATTMSFLGCKKENSNPAVPVSINIAPVSSDNGILKFKDKETLLSTVEELQQKNFEEISQWEKSLNFQSQFSIFNEVTDQENIHEEKCIKSRDLSVKHSDYYFNVLKEKTLKEVTYEDGSTSYSYNIFDPSVVNVINKEGMVVIANVLYQYTDNQLKQTPYDGNTSISTIKTASKENDNVTVTDYVPVKDSKNMGILTSYNWSQGMGWTYWDGNNRRATMSVTGYSNSSGYSSNTIVYYVNVTVQKKNFFGNWVAGDATCCYLYCNWDYRFGLASNSAPFNCDTYYRFSPLSSTPVMITYPTTYWPSINNLTVNLEPNGTWFVSGGYNFFCDAVNVYRYSFSSNVCGGIGGIHVGDLYR